MADPSKDLVNQFSDLFLTDQPACGHRYPATGDAPERNATEGHAPAEADYAQHLAGRRGLGLVLVWRDGRCRAGCVDIDCHHADGTAVDLAALAGLVKALGLPFIICRSKSGGAHLWIFIREPGVTARVLRRYLTYLGEVIGLRPFEVFPKQDAVDLAKDERGSWVNLPYFGGERTTTYALDDKGGPLTLAGFVAAAGVARVTATEIEKCASALPTDPKREEFPRRITPRFGRALWEKWRLQYADLLPNVSNNRNPTLNTTAWLGGRLAGGGLLAPDQVLPVLGRLSEFLRTPNWRYTLRRSFGQGRADPFEVAEDAEASPEIPYPDPPDEAAYYGLAGDYVRLLAPHTEADLTAVLAQFLALFGNVIGAVAYWQVEDDVHRLKLFILLVGMTAKGRKGLSYNRALKPFKLISDPDIEAWVVCCQMQGLSTGEGLINRIRDATVKVDRKTGKSVVTDEGIEDKRLMVFAPEFTEVLAKMYREGASLSPVLRMAWDGDRLENATKNSAQKSTGAHVSLVAHVTRAELRANLNRTEMTSGFMNRFLPICSRQTLFIADDKLKVVDEKALAGIAARLAAAIEFACTLDPSKPLARDAAAQMLWNENYERLARGQVGMVGAMLARAEAQVMRLAALYALLESSGVIKEPHLRAALALFDYSERSVRHIFGDLVGDPVADKILAALRAKKPDGLTLTEVWDLFGRHVSAWKINVALDALVATRLIEKTKDKSTGGRAADRWRAL
jgi:hypothetical protein